MTEFSPTYLHCSECQTLIARRDFDVSISRVDDDARDLYGREYWYSHQREMGFPDIEIRARRDLPERCVHWLRTLLKYKSPPGNALEIGCAHGAFVALMQSAGFDATGLELSPTIAAFAARTFNIPILTGRIEEQNLHAATFDVIALMDVLEHLPSPRSTMQCCLDLLRDDGILIIQTPRYKEGCSYSSMLAQSDSFLEQLKGNEHLYLFSASSLERMLTDLGALQLQQEEPIFSYYDQFVVVGKSPLKESIPSLESEHITRSQRLVQGLLDARIGYVDIRDKLLETEADRAARLAVIEDLSVRLQASEEDRTARLGVIEDLSRQLQASEEDRTARLGVIEDLSRQLLASEADRTARLGVIEDLSRHLLASEADRSARMSVIENLSLQLQASEADRAARLEVIKHQGRNLGVLEEECAHYKRTLQDLACSRSVRILRRLGVRLAIPSLTRAVDLPWLQLRPALVEYSLQTFKAEFVNSRPDLEDVRAYNRQMIDIFSGIYNLKGKRLLDVGASPHGFALERALEIGVSQYCGVGLGVPSDVLIREGDQIAVLLNMNADRLDIAPGSFDAIVSLSTFEHFCQPDVVLKEMHRVLKTGGRVLLNFQPVWTSPQGHHLHHIPDVCKLLPKWAHLKWTQEQMLQNLGPVWPATASMRLEEVVHWIYHSDEINRLSASVLRRALETSPLVLEWITPLRDTAETDLADAEAASQHLPYSSEELATKGYSALLNKRS